MFGGANMQQLLKQAKAMQEQMARDKQELEESVFTTTSGGGMVEVEMNGKHELMALKIKPEAVDASDVEMLEDLIVAAYNEAYADADELEKELMPDGMGALL